MPFGFDPGHYLDAQTGAPTAVKDIEEYAGLVPPLGKVILLAEDLGLELVADIMGPANPTGGYGGWELISRPRRKAMTEWTGRDPLSIGLTIMLDGFARGRSVERECRRLERFAGLGKGQPPTLLVSSGGLIPHDTYHGSYRWVIESLEWGDKIVNENELRVRQFADIVLLEFVEDRDLIRIPAIKRPKKRFVKAKAGDTLRKIAARTKSDLKDLKKWNEIRDADKELVKGKRIRVR